MEQELKPELVKPEDLTKEDVMRLLDDKQKEIENYEIVLKQSGDNYTQLCNQYNEDMTYISTINSNLIKHQRAKEDLIQNIITSTVALMTLDREEIAPDREEKN